MSKNRIPKFKNRVIIICEGQEDEGYIKHLISLNVWNKDVYDFKTENAKGAGNIVSRYESVVSNESESSVVLIFCDTDKPPHEGFMGIRNKLRELYGGDSAFNRVVIYANPCTMRIVLAHLMTRSKLKTQSKSRNAGIIESLTNVKDYKASKKQISEICKKITRENYYIMKENIKTEAEKKYDISGSTNFFMFLERFEGNDTTWIREINKGLNY